jgi:hypothetical protein
MYSLSSGDEYYAQNLEDTERSEDLGILIRGIVEAP